MAFSAFRYMQSGAAYLVRRRSHAGNGRNSVSSDTTFWYSRTSAGISIVLLFIIVLMLSGFVPPCQSEDESDHLARAYLLSKGHIFLGSERNTTGGYVDVGLLEYTKYFDQIAVDYGRKITNSGLRRVKDVQWKKDKRFRALPNTAEYFPLPYAPQAFALIVGESAGMSVGDSYYLARLFSMTAALGLLWVALRSYPVPMTVVALFVTPIALFQLCAASLDSISFATCVLVGSLFLRGCDTRFDFTRGMHAGLAVCIFSLATSRSNLILLTLLPAALFPVRNSRSYLISCTALIVLSGAWICFALATVRGMPVRELSAFGIASYYLTHFQSLLIVFGRTVVNTVVLQKYWETFVGVLGYLLDAPFDSRFYLAFGLLFLTLATISLQLRPSCFFSRGNLVLTLSAITSLFLVFFLMLIVLTDYPAKIISGVVGRYFYPSAIFLGFAMFNKELSPIEKRLGLFIILCMIGLSTMSMPPKLLSRYWIGDSVLGGLR